MVSVFDSEETPRISAYCHSTMSAPTLPHDPDEVAHVRLPRFEAVSRRWLLTAGGIGALALLDACGNNDAAVFAKAPKVSVAGGATTPATSPGSTAPTTAASNNPTTTVASGNTNPMGVTTTAPPAISGTPLGASAQLNVTFSFQASGGMQVRNPYICVWIEDTKGNLVQNLAIWYGQPRYIQHMNRWYAAEVAYLNAGGRDNTAAVSSGTRAAGQYQLKWDGTNVNGQRVAQGDYVLCIEAAREHGPYSLITGNITAADKKASFTFPDNTELVGATAEYVV